MYTVVLTTTSGYQYNECLSMPDDPDYALGISQMSTCKEGDHLGEEIVLNSPPEKIQEHIISRLGEDFAIVN